MTWDAMLSAGATGAAVTFASNLLIAWYKSRHQERTIGKVIQSRQEIESQKSLTEQFAALMKASESYREEVRTDMDRMRNEYDLLHEKYQREVSDMKEFYEGEMDILRQKIANLTEEVVSYRRENGALQLLLEQRGIEIPDWVVRNKDFGK